MPIVEEVAATAPPPSTDIDPAWIWRLPLTVQFDPVPEIRADFVFAELFAEPTNSAVAANTASIGDIKVGCSWCAATADAQRTGSIKQ